MFRDNLPRKRYLLVLDDIWNESYEKWVQLRTYLTCGDQDSKVVGSPVHVTVKSDAIGLLESLDASKLRTLIFLTNISENRNEKEVSVILKFKYLRVLKISCCSLTKVCESIGKLKHLRYLNLWRCRDLGSISKSISNFICLQTLILRQCNEVKFYAKGGSKLINLRYVDVKFLKDGVCGGGIRVLFL